jgi:hypothetical protein
MQQRRLYQAAQLQHLEEQVQQSHRRQACGLGMLAWKYVVRTSCARPKDVG